MPVSSRLGSDSLDPSEDEPSAAADLEEASRVWEVPLERPDDQLVAAPRTRSFHVRASTRRSNASRVIALRLVGNLRHEHAHAVSHGWLKCARGAQPGGGREPLLAGWADLQRAAEISPTMAQDDRLRCSTRRTITAASFREADGRADSVSSCSMPTPERQAVSPATVRSPLSTVADTEIRSPVVQRGHSRCSTANGSLGAPSSGRSRSSRVPTSTSRSSWSTTGAPTGAGTWSRSSLSRIPRVVAIKLLKNYGQHNANLCGFRAARGDFVITMDDDGQNPPEEIAKADQRRR